MTANKAQTETPQKESDDGERIRTSPTPSDTTDTGRPESVETSAGNSGDEGEDSGGSDSGDKGSASSAPSEKGSEDSPASGVDQAAALAEEAKKEAEQKEAAEKEAKVKALAKSRAKTLEDSLAAEAERKAGHSVPMSKAVRVNADGLVVIIPARTCDKFIATQWWHFFKDRKVSVPKIVGESMVNAKLAKFE